LDYKGNGPGEETNCQESIDLEIPLVISRILSNISLRSINGEYVLLSIIIKNEREVIAAATTPITIGTVAEYQTL
jgi:hypothetical protein